MKYLRWLLFPISLVYGLVVIIRNWFYDAGIFKSYSFSKPIISVGNLEVGGAGKSPMTEYLIRQLKGNYKIATLSRGYGRETKGYLVAEEKHQESRDKNQDEMFSDSIIIPTAIGTQNPKSKTQNSPTTHNIQLSSQIGDEPAQFKHKFPDITVAVCEKRVVGLNRLLPDHDLIILDDAYQHRAVTPGLSILLFDFNKINEPRMMLPSGNYREPFSGRWRAQIIIVTKCPINLSDEQKQVSAQRIQPLPYQQLFFAGLTYQPLQYLDRKPADFDLDENTTIFLLTGIANADPLLNHLKGFSSQIIHHNYPDHHPFTLKNITKLADEFLSCAAEKKLIITTEKDAQRLNEQWFKISLDCADNLPVFVLPIEVEFLNYSKAEFDQLIFEYVREHTEFDGVH